MKSGNFLLPKKMDDSKPKFRIGKLTITLFAKLALERAGQKATDFLNLHKNSNYGEITPEERKHNDVVLKSKNRNNKQILSVYTTDFNETIWVVTRFDQNNSITTILLPREYDIIFGKSI